MSADTDLALLTPVLELAVVVAQTGERAVPPLPSPVGLRPFLNFTRRVPPPALRAAKRVLEENDDYRARVALVATDDLVGRAGVLFVQRPQGWEAELAVLVGEGEASAEDRSALGGASGTERQLERRLRGAQESARRAEAALAKAEDAALRARADAAAAQLVARDERAARREADEAKGAALGELTALRAGREALLREIAALKSTVAALRRETVELVAEQWRLREVETRRLALDSSIEQAVAAANAIRDAVSALARPITDEGSDAPSSDAPSSDAPSRDSRQGSTVVDPPGRGPVVPNGQWRPTPSRAERARSAEELRSVGRRTPIALPLAVLEESTEAALFLIRTPNAIVLVDGYNVSKLRWGDRPPAEQRQRLVDTLGELEARTGAEIQVIFDGAEIVGPPPVPGVGRRPVRVSFSPPDVEADDVLIELAATIPLVRPVVVVSGDRRVQQGVRRSGANVISSVQLIQALGMSPGGSIVSQRS